MIQRHSIQGRDDTQSPIQALIIGIDQYKSDKVKNLDGAAADADDMCNFLRTDLQVPDKQIVNLRNGRATRSAILSELKALKKRDARRGDPYLVYFAGHGALAKAPDEHRGSKNVSMIVPYDGDVDAVQQKECTHNIPDWTIGALLDDLAGDTGDKGKGNNITVILDCCHSGSGTRNAQRARRVVMQDDYRVPCQLDEDIVRSNVTKRWPEKDARSFFGSRMKSHVLLSACREGELAYEGGGHGQFTQALLRTLRNSRAHKITYQELMKRIVVKEQTPQCEGYHTDRLIFDGRSPNRGDFVCTASQQQDGGHFTIDIGLVHGINDGAQFDIYPSLDYTCTNLPLATMVTTSTTAFQARLVALNTMAPVPILPSSCYAVQTSMGKAMALQLYLPDAEEFQPVFEALAEELQRQQRLGCSRIILCSRTLANLTLRMHDGRIEYLICDPMINSYGPRRLCETTEAETRQIRPVLRAAADFFWHLYRTPAPKEQVLHQRVSIEAYRLRLCDTGQIDLLGRRLRSIDGENMRSSRTLDIIVEDETAVYGFLLRNSSSVPLYVWVFYFDCGDMSIDELYRPPAVGRHAEPPLQAKGDLHIGFGLGGGEPFECALRQDQATEVGFLKFFLLTESADLSGMQQISPFGEKHFRDVRQYSREIKAWDTITIPVVQRRWDM